MIVWQECVIRVRGVRNMAVRGLSDMDMRGLDDMDRMDGVFCHDHNHDIR